MNAPLLVAVPPAVVTATLCAPAVPVGVTAVMLVALTTTTLVAALPPTVTLVAPVKLVPVMVIEVPPNVVPDVGETRQLIYLTILHHFFYNLVEHQIHFVFHFKTE